MPGSGNHKRYHISMPQDLFDELESLAKKRHTTTLDIVRRFLKMGLVIDRVEEDPDADILIREGDSLQKLLLF